MHLWPTSAAPKLFYKTSTKSRVLHLISSVSHFHCTQERTAGLTQFLFKLHWFSIVTLWEKALDFVCVSFAFLRLANFLLFSNSDPSTWISAAVTIDFYSERIKRLLLLLIARTFVFLWCNWKVVILRKTCNDCHFLLRNEEAVMKDAFI